MKVSFAIMAHPKRLGNIDPLLARLHAQGAQSVSVALDVTDAGALLNSLKAWAMFAPDSTHHVVLQDDIAVCSDFVSAAQWCAELRPAVPMSFFVSARYATDVAAAEQARANWMFTRKFLYTQAFMLPTPIILGYITWAKTFAAARPHRNHDDVCIDAYCHQVLRCPIFMTVPALVEHMGAGAGLVGHTMWQAPKAARYIGDDGKACSIPFDDLRAIESRGYSRCSK